MTMKLWFLESSREVTVGFTPPRNGSLVVAVEEFGVVGGVPSVEDHPFKVLAFFCGHGGCCGFCVG